MLASLAAEVRIQERLDQLGASVSFLSALDGRISNSRLNQALRGLKDLELNDAQRILALTARLIELRDAFAPVPISWDRPRDTRWLLENLTATTEEIRKTILTLFRERS
jgi:hypothetical protein